VDLPTFQRALFAAAEYDLFTTPLWVDPAIEALRGLVSLDREISVIEEGARILKQELRITTQRVNLFEKVKIPDTREAIRRIKIYIGDQMANAVGRSKIAKRKIEELSFAGAQV
jgi:V/A-type H+-transporting ATPase subunit D